MAYFSNGSEGGCFDDQCDKCRYGKSPCPIAFVQLEYNYAAANNSVATKILNTLIEQDGTCTMWEMAKEVLEIDPNQLELF